MSLTDRIGLESHRRNGPAWSVSDGRVRMGPVRRHGSVGTGSSLTVRDGMSPTEWPGADRRGRLGLARIVLTGWCGSVGYVTDGLARHGMSLTGGPGTVRHVERIGVAGSVADGVAWDGLS